MAREAIGTQQIFKFRGEKKYSVESGTGSPGVVHRSPSPLFCARVLIRAHGIISLPSKATDLAWEVSGVQVTLARQEVHLGAHTLGR